jgi:hypothetical protein
MTGEVYSLVVYCLYIILLLFCHRRCSQCDAIILLLCSNREVLLYSIVATVDIRNLLIKQEQASRMERKTMNNSAR